MKKLLSFVLATLMLSTSAIPVFAEDAPAGLTLAEDSHLVLDAETGYVDKIDGTITVGELKKNFAGDVSVAGKSDDADVATDDVIGDYKALIYGDVNRDGKVNLSDVSGTLQIIANWDVDVNKDAADVNKTGDVNLTDVTKLLKKVAGWADISLGNVRLVYENKAETAENEDSTLKLQFVDMMYKHGRDISAYPNEYSYKMKLAKNEDESCQALLVSETAREGLSAELTEFVNKMKSRGPVFTTGDFNSNEISAEYKQFLVDADIYVHSHTHLPAVFKQGYFRVDTANSSVSHVTKLFVNTSSTLDYGGYGETQGYKPTAKDTPLIRLDGTRKAMSASL